MLTACLGLAALEPPFLGALRDALFDRYQKLMPRERKSMPAVIVEIDERSLETHGQWPWPRALTAELVRAVASAMPAAIGVDVLFTQPDRSSAGADALLAQAIQGRKVVLGIAGLEKRDRRFPFPPQAAPTKSASRGELPLRRFDGHLQSRAEINRAAAGRGLIGSDAPDGVVRRVLLAARVGQVVVPALTVEMVRVAAGLPFIEVSEHLLKTGDLAIPIQPDGAFWVHFSRHDPKRFVSAGDVLAGRTEPERFQDKYVLLGVTGLGPLEMQATPLGERIAGVEVHAQILEQFFDGSYLRRPAGALWIEAALLAVAGVLLVVVVPRLRARIAAGLLLLVLVILAAAGLFSFRSSLLVDVATPALGAIIVFGTVLAVSLAEAARQRHLLREAQAKLAGELEAARRIQTGMLPNPKLAFARETRFDLHAHLEPARMVGGDFYDCFLVDAHRLFFVVADVSGKGLPASLFMALAKSLLKSIALRTGDDPGAVLTSAGAEIARDNPEALFVTAFAGLLDMRTGTLAFCNAGHEPPLLRRSDAILERLEHAGGPPLCAMDAFEYPTGHRKLAAGEWLCVVTDGVTEAMNERGEPYGAARLQKLLAKAPRSAAPDAIVEAVRGAVHRFIGAADRSDDIALLCVRWNGGS